MNKFTPEQKEKYKEFTENQMDEIKNGFKNGLSEEQVSVYAKPEFSCVQMNEIESGFINGLSIEQVSVYAKPKLSCDQMSEIRSGFIDIIIGRLKEIQASAGIEKDEVQSKKDVLKKAGRSKNKTASLEEEIEL